MKIALTADWHLCTRHLGVSRRGPDFTAAAKSAILKTKEAGCTILLNGGDTFHDSRPTSANVAAAQELNLLLIENGITMYTIDGDHDHADPSWLSTVVHGKPDVGGIIPINNKTVTLPDGHTVHGVPPCNAEEFTAVLNELAASKDRPDIVLWHGMIREFCGFPTKLAVAIDEIPVKNFKAILCGDIHVRQFITKDGCLIGYPGATELRGRNEYNFKRSITVLNLAVKPITEKEIEIEHRKALAFQIRSLVQLEEVVEKLQKLPKEPWPMVFVRYDRDVKNVKPRLSAALDNPDAVLRAMGAPKADLPSLFDGTAGIPSKKVVDFITKYFPAAGAEQDLAVALCDSEADPRALIDDYVDAQLSLITSAI